MNLFSAGADWSGNPDAPDEVFIFCLVALLDVEAWNAQCEELRVSLRMAQGSEFHGREMKDDGQRLQLLKAGRDAGMRVGALVVTGWENWGEEPLSYEGVALELLRQFLPLCPLKAIWFDTEIQGKKAQTEFATAVGRCHRAIHPEVRLKARTRDSHSSRMIQLADVMAYGLRTQERGSLESPALQQFLREIAGDERNVILRR